MIPYITHLSVTDGYVYYNGGRMDVVGSQGLYWSSTPNSTSNGYNLNFNSSNFNPSNNMNRYNGLSVRCPFRCARSPPNLVNIKPCVYNKAKTNYRHIKYKNTCYNKNMEPVVPWIPPQYPGLANHDFAKVPYIWRS